MERFEEVTQDVIAAALAAATETVAECAEQAKGTVLDLEPHSAAGHPWYGVTSRIESEVDSSEAKIEEGVVVAEFGATKRRGDYALMLERMRPYLRPVADEVFPTFADRIRKRLEET
jgi:hypothetical protein